jgi:5-methylcytosine-specific restriction endonuclease McrA
MSNSLYPPNWPEIAYHIKQEVNWTCQKCGRVCLQPGQETPNWTLSQRKAYTLQVHHWNRNSRDNRRENLVALCSGCHLDYHRGGLTNIPDGQLSLDFD